MAETEEQRQERASRELEGKNIAHYSVLLSAWIQTKMERDKTLVTLSSGAIGLLITILTTVGAENYWMIFLFIISICAFITTIWSSLVIYQLNSKHLEDALRGSSETSTELEKYDKRSIRAFVVGAIAAMLIGAFSAYINLIKKENKNMANQDKNTSKVVAVNDSFNGVSQLNPEAISQRSVNGVTSLSPQAIEQNTTQSSSQSQATNTTSSSNSESKK